MARRSERSLPPLVREHAMLFTLIGLNVLVGIIGLFFPPGSINELKCNPASVSAAWDRVTSGEFAIADARVFATLLTYAFLHANAEHLFFNLLYLWMFGFIVGDLLGHRWVLAIYLITALGGSVGYVLSDPESPIPMLGASGAVMGFQGAYLGLAVRFRLPDPMVWPLADPVSPWKLGLFAVIGFALDLGGVVNPGDCNTAFATHIGGFVTGILLTSFIAPRPADAIVR